MREGMYSSAALPSGGGSLSLFPQSSLWLCACCSLEEGSWITLRILLKSYLRLCLNRGGETFHWARLWRSIRQHSYNQQPLFFQAAAKIRKSGSLIACYVQYFYVIILQKAPEMCTSDCKSAKTYFVLLSLLTAAHVVSNCAAINTSLTYLMRNDTICGVKELSAQVCKP